MRSKARRKGIVLRGITKKLKAAALIAALSVAAAPSRAQNQSSTPIFETQEGLAPTTDDALLKAAATRAGLDPNAIATCANSQAARDSVDAQMRLAVAAGVDQTPLLAVNGRMLPDFNAIPYDQLKKIIEYQEKLDGVEAAATIGAPSPSSKK